jgi:hypothetical protein
MFEAVEPGGVEQVVGRGGVAGVDGLFEGGRFAGLECLLIGLLQLFGVAAEGGDGVKIGRIVIGHIG